MERLKKAELISTNREFFRVIDFKEENFFQVRSGKAKFTHDHLLAAAKYWNISVDWLYGLTEKMQRIVLD